MANEKDPLKKYLVPGLELFPEIDLEASIMIAVREEAALHQKARQLRRKGFIFLTVFLFLLVLALWKTSSGYTFPVYQNQLVSFGLATLFLLILFVQFEAWGHRPLPVGQINSLDS
jgi:hypothetical protein